MHENECPEGVSEGYGKRWVCYNWASMKNAARARVEIRGRVQGVFFRAFTRDVGARLGLAGWVRNLPGGSVEAVFEGERPAVEEAIRLCRGGPPASRVDHLDVLWEEYTGEFGDFTIRY